MLLLLLLGMMFYIFHLSSTMRTSREGFNSVQAERSSSAQIQTARSL